MVQDDDPQGPEPQEPGEAETPERSSIWPWIALAVLVLIVILLLWWFWRQPKQSSTGAVDKVTQTSVVLPDARPEPVVPEPSSGTSSTPFPELVPDVIGDRRDAAARTLEGAGYVVSASVAYTSGKASGIVVGQRPAGGVALEPGRTVGIVVSATRESAGDVKMPSLVGLSQSTAESKVEAAGLSPQLTYGNQGIADGHVISQWPLPGELVPAGSEALIQIQLTP